MDSCYNCKDISTTALLQDLGGVPELGWQHSLFSQLHVSVCLGAENCWFLAALQALTFHQDIFAAVVPQNQSFERKYAGIFHFQVHLFLQSTGGLHKSSVMFCVTPWDNLYAVPLPRGKWPETIPASSVVHHPSHRAVQWINYKLLWGYDSAWPFSPAVPYPYFNPDKSLLT